MIIDPSIQAFDAEVGFSDLFNQADLADWQAWLSSLHGAKVELLAPHEAAGGDWVIEHELEPLLAVRAAGTGGLGETLRAMFHAFVRERIRYRLASSLHINATQSDFERLRASEARYRELAEQLEQRVKEQVTELQRAQLYAFQAEQLRSVAQLAAGMAHEINNPLGFLSSNLRTAKSCLQDLQPAPGSPPEVMQDFLEMMDEALEGGRRIAVIVAQLREFSNVDRSAACEADIAGLVHAAMAVASTEWPGHATVRYSGPQTMPWRCEPGRISQALHQLMRNACQAVSKDCGEIELGCELVGQELVLRVRDNGCGMTADVCARACDPFFSTRDVGQGVGLGLSLAAETARHHGGRLTLRSEPGQGTEVELTLPALPTVTGQTAT
jgi:two-component system NtrC family sensor kinase